MARHRTILQNEFPYHIGGRCINKDWFQIPVEEVWEIFSRHLFFAHHAYEFRIQAFVLMTNHFHLLASTPKSNVSQIMHYLMTQVSLDLTRAGNRINQTFGGRHWKCVIQQPNHFLHAYKYVYRNPVEAKLAKRAELYPYSTLSGLLGGRHMYIPMMMDETLFSDIEGTLSWLNEAPDAKSWRDVGVGLQRPVFELCSDRYSRKEHRLTHQRL